MRLGLSILFVGPISAFTFPACSNPSNVKNSALFMGLKGGQAKRQMELAKKLALAKEQAKKKAGGGDDVDQAKAVRRQERLSDEEIKRQNDMKRFEDLLNSESATANYEFNAASGYLTRAQEEEAATAGFKGIDRLYEGDPAPVSPFEDLVNIKTDNALGKQGASRVVPWLHKNTARHKEYLLVVTDPREKSTELREALKSMLGGVPKDILEKTIIINADSPPENRRWLKKNNASSLNVLSDEKREWMREYTALGEKRWAMCMFILGDGRVQKLVRELDGDLVCTVVKNAVRSLDF